nr:hypothetical protein [uncultured Ligilactobacillus sp.]
MELIGDLAGIITFILFFRLIYLFFKSRKTKDWSKFKKDGIIFVICFVLTGLFADTSSNDESTNASNTSSKVVKSSTNSKNNNKTSSTVTENNKKSSSKKTKNDNGYQAINKEISDTVAENQKYAEQGNSNFNGYSYISKVEYIGNKDIDVYIYNEFNNLSDKEKTNILNEIQGMVQMPLLDHDKISNDDCREGLFIDIKLGNNSIGHSKITNHKEYKFN